MGDRAYSYVLYAKDVKMDYNEYDITAQSVRKLTPGADGDYSKGTLETIIGSTAGYADGTGLKVKMKQPYEILVYDDNTLYFTDTVNYLIRKVTIK